MYVNDVLSIEKVLEGTRSYRTVNFYTYAGGLTGIEVDNLSIRDRLDKMIDFFESSLLK